MAMADDRVKYLWHHQLHSDLVNERLHYALIEVKPTYKRDRALLRLKNAAESLGVRSYAIWELIGRDDLMFQAWLPVAITMTRFEDELTAQFAASSSPPPSLNIFPVAVDEFVYHWMWGVPRINVDVAKREIDARHLVDVNGPVDIPSQSRALYKNNNYMYRLSATKTLKFFMLVSSAGRSFKVHSPADMADRLSSAIRESPRVLSPCLMKIRGDGVAYLLTGRIKREDFELLAEEFQPRITELAQLESIGSRTSTYISAYYAPLDRREQLVAYSDTLSATVPTPASMRDLLTQPEGERLEFKTSVWLNVKHAAGLPTPKIASKAEMIANISKGVVGMLNAFGGTIVVGVAESKDFTIAQLELAGYRRPAKHGDIYVVGLEPQYVDKWDAFKRDLMRHLRASISVSPLGPVDLHPAEIDGKTVCVIQIQWATRYYFALEAAKGGHKVPVFYGRVGADTLPLHGADMEEFRVNHPRKT
jgi:hypothetical protein